MKLIAAVSKNWGIGNNNKLLFHIPRDMKFFRETTLGKTVLMGRKTLESFPGGRPLKNRTNIVLTRDKDYSCEDAVICHSAEEALGLGFDNEEIFVIGGETVYKQLLGYCSTCYITKVFEEVEADAFMENLDESDEWEIAELSEKLEDNGHTIRFCRYERIRGK